MSTINMQFNRALFERQMTIYGKEYGLTAKEVLQDQMRLWLADLIRSTPPSKKLFDKATWANLLASLNVARLSETKLGERAAEADVRRLFVDLDKPKEAQWRILLSGEDQVRVIQDKPRSGGRSIFYGVEADLFRPSASKEEMREQHLKYRGQNGRVTKAGTYTRTVGRWKYVDRMHVKKTALNRYVREVKSHVGTLKAAWYAAAQAIGFGASIKVPSRLKKLAGSRAEGGGTNMVTNKGTGFIEAVNKMPYSQEKCDSIASALARTRSKDMEKHFEHRLQQLNRRREKEDARAA